MIFDEELLEGVDDAHLSRLAELAGDVELGVSAPYLDGVGPFCAVRILVLPRGRVGARLGTGALEIAHEAMLADPAARAAVVESLIRRLTPWHGPDPSPFPRLVPFPWLEDLEHRARLGRARLRGEVAARRAVRRRRRGGPPSRSFGGPPSVPLWLVPGRRPGLARRERWVRSFR